LNQLGYIYRSINTSLVDTEKLLALLNEPTEVNDKPDAPDLLVHNGEIEFGKYLFHHFMTEDSELLPLR
jgi:ATP-binding cassette subfamily B (MDR/TAP) protein 6